MNYLYIPACPDAIAQAWHLSTMSLFFPVYFQLQHRGYNYSDQVIFTVTASLLTFWVIKAKRSNCKHCRDNLRPIKFGRRRRNDDKLWKRRAGPLGSVLRFKKSDVSEERRTAGDTWRKSRSGSLLRHTHTHTHKHQVTASRYTQIHTAVRGRRRSFTKHHHHHPSPGYHWHRFSLTHSYKHTQYPVSLSHTLTHTCQEATCCPWGLWRIITQQCRLKSRVWTSFSSAQCSSSPRHPIKQGSKQ